MIVKGKKVIVEYPEVEINPITVLSEMERDFIPKGLAYLNISDGFWYKETGFDYHKLEELYSKDRKATEEELELHKAFQLVYSKTKELYE
jgi:hypothetical protein